MGLNKIAGTQLVNTKLWTASEEFKANVSTRKRRGRPPAYENYENRSNPRTPFEALRFKLELSQKEWAFLSGVSNALIGQVERGDSAPGIDIAKRMQEEARKRGVAVTLDELYQHVIPWGQSSAAPSLSVAKE